MVPLNTIADLRCVLCGNVGFHPVTTKNDFRGQPIDIVRCGRCQLTRVHPFPTPDSLKELYSADYFHSSSPLTGGYEDYAGDEDNIRRTFRRRLPLFESQLPGKGAPGAVLDVGCATGCFLEVMREHGWRGCGIDLSPFAVDQTRLKGFEVVCGDLTSPPWPEQSFDVVTMWDVIEHLEDPIDTLRRCARLLKSGGLFILSTPDASAMTAKLLGTYWLGYRSAGEHLYFFGRDAVHQLLRAAGFAVLSTHAVGKYMRLGYVATRLSYYTRIFRWMHRFRPARFSGSSMYLNSGDTMCVVARRT